MTSKPNQTDPACAKCGKQMRLWTPSPTVSVYVCANLECQNCHPSAQPAPQAAPALNISEDMVRRGYTGEPHHNQGNRRQYQWNAEVTPIEAAQPPAGRFDPTTKTVGTAHRLETTAPGYAPEPPKGEPRACPDHNSLTVSCDMCYPPAQLPAGREAAFVSDAPTDGPSCSRCGATMQIVSYRCPSCGSETGCSGEEAFMSPEESKCQLCGEPMPAGEEMFNYHGYNGLCPKVDRWSDATVASYCAEREAQLREELASAVSALKRYSADYVYEKARAETAESSVRSLEAALQEAKSRIAELENWINEEMKNQRTRG